MKQQYYDAQKLWDSWHVTPPDGSPFDLFTAQYPDIRPEDFDSGDENLEAKYKRRMGREAIYGRKGSGGFVGRLRVIVGQPLEHRVIAFGKEKALERFEHDPHALTDKTVNAELRSELKRLLPSPCAVYLHRGKVNLKNHVHILQAPNTTKLGRNCGIVKDDILQTLAGYLGRHQYWERGLADAFITDKAMLPVNAKGNRERMPSDSFFVGCNRPVPLAEIVRVLGPCPPKRERFVPGKNPRQEKTVTGSREQVAAAQLPLLQGGVTPEGLDAIMRLRRVWAEGILDGEPFAHGPVKMADAGFSIGIYFNRTKLFPGEVYDLEQYAIALGLGASALAARTEDKNLVIARSTISDASTRPPAPAVASLR